MSRPASCSETVHSCATCQCVETTCNGEQEALLLAPLDEDAGTALREALEKAKFAYNPCASVLTLPAGRRDLTAINALLTSHLPRALHSRVKAVFMHAEGPRTILSAFLHAETLPVFFEQAEVAWAQEALRDDWLFSVFHPIIEATTGRRYAYEALIRARNPHTKEVMSAGQLIHACGRLNLQHQLDQQARVSAIRAAAGLQQSDARFFVNFLPGAIYDPALSLKTTMEAAERHAIDVARLVFEVVETEQIENIERLRRILDYYREKGAGIALDDIGSGFSSLHYLTELQPDYVKIDRHISAGAAASPSARHTLDSIVGLAKKLNARVVAEGIETRAQMQACVEAGVDYLQGFLFARPANPPERVPEHLFTPLKAAA